MVACLAAAGVPPRENNNGVRRKREAKGEGGGRKGESESESERERKQIVLYLKKINKTKRF